MSGLGVLHGYARGAVNAEIEYLGASYAPRARRAWSRRRARARDAGWRTPNVDVVTGAAIIVGLQKLGPPAADVVKDFLTRVLAPTGDALGTAMAHPLVEWQKRRVARAAKLTEAAARQVQQVGVEPKAVPERLLMGILDKGSLEDDEVLVEHWATLLANASMAPDSVLPAFVTILGELSSLEARLLDRILNVTFQIADLQRGISGLGTEVSNRLLSGLHDKLRVGSLTKALSVEDENVVEIVVDNLERLALIRKVGVMGDDPEIEFYEPDAKMLVLTSFGAAFVRACSKEEDEGPGHLFDEQA